MQTQVGGFSHPVLDHFSNPRNAGIVEGYNYGYLEENNPWLIRIRFTFWVEGDHIQQVRFQTQSCVTTTACCSALTEMVQGQTVREALSITPEQLSEHLGTLRPEKMYCARLSVATLRRALQSPVASTAPHLSQKGEFL